MKKHLIFSLALTVVVPLCATMLVACSDDDDGKVDTSAITLKVGGTKTIETTIDITSVESDNDFVAEIEEDGTVYALHVGETKVKVNGKYKISVTVEGNYSLYPDPVLEWGASKSTIKKKETAELSEETDTYLAYDNYGSALTFMYQFGDDGLNATLALVKSTYRSTLLNYLDERYWGYAYGSYIFMGFDAYDNDKITTGVAVEKYNSSYYMVMYIPFTPDSSKSISIEEIEVDPFEDILPIFEAQIDEMNLED